MTIDPLFGKRVLFMAPKFFGYEIEIAEALAVRGALVDTLPDRPFNSPFMTAMTRFVPTVVIPAATKYYQKRLGDFGRADYDFVFIVNGQTLSEALLSDIRTSYPRAKFILYMWDSIENRSAVIRKFRFFDEISTFDLLASKKYSLPLRHLFFGTGFTPETSDDYCYDLSFVGTAHSDRYRIVNLIDNELPPHFHRFWYMFLQAWWVYYGYQLTNVDFRGAPIEKFQFTALSRQKVNEIVRQSRAILDIEHPQQTGLTIRTLETFGSGKKLVTTNASILDTEIYNPQNICVIDRNRPIVPLSFFESPYVRPHEDIYDRYSLNGWLDDILISNGKIAPRTGELALDRA